MGQRVLVATYLASFGIVGLYYLTSRFLMSPHVPNIRLLPLRDQTSVYLHRWIMANETFGPMVRDWEQKRCVSCRVKAIAIGSMALVGGVHIYTLAAMFTTYTAFMILNHAGVDYPRFPFKTLGILAAKHDRHHHSMLSGNYAAVTPLPDIIFGTVE